MRTHRSVLGGVALAMALLTAGCSGDNTDPGATGTPTASKSSSTSNETLSPEQRAQTDATDALMRYFVVLDDLGKDPDALLSKLKSVAISTQLFVLQENRYKQWRSKGWRQVGDTKVVEHEVQDVSLDNSNPKKGQVPYVVIKACVDVSDSDVVDRSGQSVVPTDRPDTLTSKYTIANYSWDKDPRGGWRVTSVEDVQGETCDGS